LSERLFHLSFCPEFLTPDECRVLRELIDAHSHPAKLDTGGEEYRKASSADLNQLNHPLVLDVERRIAFLLMIPQERCEGLQGQRYEKGEYYVPHWDAFHLGTLEHRRHVTGRGQRTWTGMIYLNEVEDGGETTFPEISVGIVPRAGLAVMWHNLGNEQRPHPLALHGGAPVLRGSKYIVTAWFR